MPFLRRRGIVASESDMRRHTFPESLSTTEQLPASTASTDLPTLFSPPDGPSMPPVPAVPATPPGDSLSSSIHATRSGDDLLRRPESPPIQEETSKHHRFSLLRFRTASDSQLAAKAKLHAAAERPPVPRRTCILFTPSFTSLLTVSCKYNSP
jgi:hypothetical protein